MDIRFHSEVNIPVGKIMLKGELFIPGKANSIVVFSHGSGSSRLSKRNREVARSLQEKKFGTLLFDLLTEEEDQHYHNRFDIGLLTKRLAAATEWLDEHPAAKSCGIGYFGASTGAASALRAAAILPQIQAVVSRGGRPDLAMDDLDEVEAPTLLLVGSLDYDVLLLNKQAYIQLNCEKKLEIIEGATHLFEEPGMMKKVCESAGEWFKKYLHPVVVTK
ncbi:MAG TPA: dienelactone hydrolase family protein [Chitinophagaceae bacterium]|nr:dienelactone hydrolase family protein [Chitinophagaceae bacterium]